jgi:hypothetical protein
VTLEQRYAVAEQRLDADHQRRMRRTPSVLIGVTAVLVCAVGVTAAIDLQRLQSPRGAALAWTEAAVFGNCPAYLSLSRPVDPLTERRTDDQVCRDLRRVTANARTNANRIELLPGAIQQRGATATALVEVRRPDGTTTGRLSLVRRGAHWLVLRDTQACDAVGCA